MGHSIETAARHWLAANDCLFADFHYLEQGLWFRYEDFTRRSHKHLRMIHSFLQFEVPFDPNVLHKVRAHGIESNVTGLQNLNSKSIGRLASGDVSVIYNGAIGLVKKLGYDRL